MTKCTRIPRNRKIIREVAEGTGLSMRQSNAGHLPLAKII